MTINFLPILLLAAVLGGCASGVKLDDVPVEDKSATSSGVTTQGVENNQNAAQTGAVVQKTASANVAAGPAGVANVVFFDYDSFSVRAEALPLIEKHARFLQANKQSKVNLEGHTDERGGREYNLALGQKRAEAVRQALSLLGVSDNQMEAVSFGKEKPASQGADDAAQAKNRRVEIRY